MSHHTTHSSRRPKSTRQTVTVSGGHKSYFTTTSPAEVCFGWHRAVRKGTMVYVSGITAAKDDADLVESDPERHDAATAEPNEAEARQSQGTVLLPSGSGSTMTSASEEDRDQHESRGDDDDRNVNLNEYDDDNDEQPPPYDRSGLGDLYQRQMDSETTLQVLHPHDAKQQAIVAINRCIDAVQRLGGKRSDVARVRIVITNHEHRQAISEAFRECFSVYTTSVPTTTKKKVGRAGIPVSEVGAAVTILVVPGGFANPDVLVEVDVEAVLDGRYYGD